MILGVAIFSFKDWNRNEKCCFIFVARCFRLFFALVSNLFPQVIKSCQVKHTQVLRLEMPHSQYALKASSWNKPLWIGFKRKGKQRRRKNISSSDLTLEPRIIFKSIGDNPSLSSEPHPSMKIEFSCCIFLSFLVAVVDSLNGSVAKSKQQCRHLRQRTNNALAGQGYPILTVIREVLMK